MELCSSLKSPIISTSLPSSEAVRRHNLFFPSDKNIEIPVFTRLRVTSSSSRKLEIFASKASSSSGITKFSSVGVEATIADPDSKDENLVFVAGATGRVGSRTVRELLKLGFNVRAGVRSAQRADSLLQSVEQMKPGNGITSEGAKPIEKLEIVECDLENRKNIGSALGNASIIICCIGASEKEIFDVTGPYRIDFQATKNLIDAATAAKVNHFILLTSLGTKKVGFPAAILNLFWGVLIWKRKAEEALLASGLPYTIVRPGGMERPTDAYKETHNITLSEEDTLFGGQVSNLQVAELMAYMATNRSISYCKVVEVIAETTAPLLPMENLLAKIPSQRSEVKPSKKTDATDEPQSAAVIEKEPPIVKPTTKRPLSPYTMYEDLKPPVSPIPTPGTSSGSNKSVIINEVAQSKQVNDILEPLSAPTETEDLVEEVIKSSPLSPYTAYDDLKPPTSPSPSAPNGSFSSQPFPNESKNMQHDTKPKTRPLSPFAMYEDLKPPTSPIPAPRR